jgi:hypothetical protein
MSGEAGSGAKDPRLSTRPRCTATGPLTEIQIRNARAPCASRAVIAFEQKERDCLLWGLGLLPSAGVLLVRAHLLVAYCN